MPTENATFVSTSASGRIASGSCGTTTRTAAKAEKEQSAKITIAANFICIYFTIIICSPSRGTSAALRGDAASSRVTPKLRRTSAALPGGPSLRDEPCKAESEGIPLPYSTPRHLLQYVTGRAKANGIMQLRRFTKRLRYRCGLCFANFNRPFQTRRDRTSLRPRATPAPSMETRLPAASLPSCDAHLPRDNHGDILHHFQLSSRRHYLIDARCCRPSSA